MHMTSTIRIEPVALSPKRFAASFGKSETWAYRLIYAGKVKSISGLGNVMIPVSEVDRLLALAETEHTRVGNRGRRPKIETLTA
jgi:hypothetical protein